MAESDTYNSRDVLTRAEQLNDEILAAGHLGQWDRVTQLKSESAKLHADFPVLFNTLAQNDIALARAGRGHLVNPRNDRVAANYPERMGKQLGISIESNDDPGYKEYWQRHFDAREDVATLQAARNRGQLSSVTNIPEEAQTELLGASDALLNAKIAPTTRAMTALSRVAPLLNEHLYTSTNDADKDEAALAARRGQRYDATAQLLRATRNPEDLDAFLTTIAPHVPKNPEGGSINQLISVARYADRVRDQHPGVNVFNEAQRALDDNKAKAILARYNGDAMKLVDYAAKRASVALKPDMAAAARLSKDPSKLSLVADPVALINFAKAEVDQEYIGSDGAVGELIRARDVAAEAQNRIESSRLARDPIGVLRGTIDRTRAMMVANPDMGYRRDATGGVTGPRADEFDLWAAMSGGTVTGADIRAMYEASVASADSNKNRALESGTAMVPPPAALLKPTAAEGGKPGPSDFVLKLRDGKIPLPEPDWAALAKAGVSDANEVLDVFAPGVPEASKTAPTSDLAERARFFNKVGQWESAKAAMAESLEYGGLEGESELKKKLESAEYLDLAEQLGKAAGDLSIDSIAKFSSVVVKTRGGTQVPLSQILPYDNFVRFRTAQGVFPSPKGAVTSAALNIAGLAARDAAPDASYIEQIKEAAARVAVARPFVGAERAIDEQGPARMVLGQRLIDQVLGGREKAFWLGTDDDLTPKHAVPAPAANIAGKVVSWDTQDPIEKHMLGLYGTSASKEFIAASVDAQTKLQERLKKSAKAKGVLQNYPKKDQVNALFGTFSTEAEANRVVPAKRQTSYLMRYRMMRQAEVPLREFIRARGMLENDELYS